MEQVRAALALQADAGLLELQAKLEKEIHVQRNYDDARTANFIVLFDGYEHEEMKTTVLGILKDAYADVGKELDPFPQEPVTVILYTGKDFSDVTRAPEWAGGMFGKLDGKIRVPVQGAAGQERALRRVLYPRVRPRPAPFPGARLPLWLHEGLAQYLSGERGGQRRPGDPAGAAGQRLSARARAATGGLHGEPAGGGGPGRRTRHAAPAPAAGRAGHRQGAGGGLRRRLRRALQPLGRKWRPVEREERQGGTAEPEEDNG